MKGLWYERRVVCITRLKHIKRNRAFSGGE